MKITSFMHVDGLILILSCRLQQSYGRQQPNQLATLMPNMYPSHGSSSMLQEPIMFSG